MRYKASGYLKKVDEVAQNMSCWVSDSNHVTSHPSPERTVHKAISFRRWQDVSWVEFKGSPSHEATNVGLVGE